MALAQDAAHRGDRANWSQAATSIGFALIQLDVTIVNVALPRLGQELGGGISALQWIVDGYALVFSVLLLIGGFLGDRYGARRVYVAGIGIFAVASTLCGLAPDIGTLIAARALQGIGAAVMLPCSLSLLNHATQHDPVMRARAVGFWAASGSIALAAGPVLGGLLLGLGSWRGVFLINLPICLLAVLLTLKVPETPREEEGQGFDPAGQILAILALTGLTGAVIEAHPLGFAHPLVLGGFRAGAGHGSFVRLGGAEVAGTIATHAAVPLRHVLDRGRVRHGGELHLLRHGVRADTLLPARPPLRGNRDRFRLSAADGDVRGSQPRERLGGRALRRQESPWWRASWSMHSASRCFCSLARASAYWLALPAFILMPAGMGTGVPAMIGAMLGRRRPLGLGGRRSGHQCGASGRRRDRRRGVRRSRRGRPRRRDARGRDPVGSPPRRGRRGRGDLDPGTGGAEVDALGER